MHQRQLLEDLYKIFNIYIFVEPEGKNKLYKTNNESLEHKCWIGVESFNIKIKSLMSSYSSTKLTKIH